MNLLARLRKFDAARRNRKIRPERIAFDQALESLRVGDVAIDCGANVGSITELLARTGADVHAFEPHPAAFARLCERIAPYPNARAVQACITATPGPVRLHLHKWDKEDPAHWSTGASIIPEKRNLAADSALTVDGISLVDFIRELDRPVKILKMDIEGAEVAVLNQLLDAGLHTVITKAFVEVHGNQIPSLKAPTEALRKRLQSMGADHFRLDWR
jgi:FkbM family methyltransferase